MSTISTPKAIVLSLHIMFLKFLININIESRVRFCYVLKKYQFIPLIPSSQSQVSGIIPMSQMKKLWHQDIKLCKIIQLVISRAEIQTQEFRILAFNHNVLTNDIKMDYQKVSNAFNAFRPQNILVSVILILEGY